MIYKMTLADSVDSMTFDLLEVPIVDKDVEGAVDNTLINGNVFTDYLWLKKQWVQKWSIMCPDEYDRLRGFYTRQWSNATVPSYKLFYGVNLSSVDVNSGDYFVINNDAPISATMSLTKLDGNATQQTYSGKNKLAPTASFSETHSGITFTGDGAGKYTISGTATAGSNSAQMTVANYTIQSGDYLHIMNSQASATCAFVFVFSDATTASPTMSPANRIWSLASYVGKTVTKIYLYASGSTVATTPITLTPMIVNSATATDFEPYVGGTASPNPDYPQEVKTVTGEQVVTVTGKNLFNPSIITEKYNFTYDASTGYLTGNTGKWTMYEIIDFGDSPQTVSATIEQEGQQSACLGLRLLYNDGTYNDIYPWNFSDKVITRTSTKPTAKVLTIPGNTSNVASYRFQLELGSTATTYEPYQSNSQEINLGKNLFDKDNYNLFNGYLNGDPTGTITANASNDIFYIPCQPNTTYTISKTASKNFAVASSAVVPSAGSAFTGRVSANNLASATITTDATAQYLLIWARNGNISGEITRQEALDSLQIELGSQATSYASYITPIELAKIGTYQDRIYKDDGKWYIEKQVGKVVLDGTETWNGYVYGGIFRAQYNVVGIKDINTNLDFVGMSDYFHVDAGVLGSTTIKVGMFCQYQHTNGVYFGAPSSVTTLNEWKTWLSTHPTTVYYALATATDTEITNSALVAQLNKTFDLYNGVNNISIVPSADAQGTIEVKTLKIYSQETILTQPTAVRLTLTDDGVINPCGCRKNIQLKMRETVQ